MHFIFSLMFRGRALGTDLARISENNGYTNFIFYLVMARPSLLLPSISLHLTR